MIPLTTYRDDAILVVGLGKSGASAAKALSAGGARVSVWDDSPAKRAEAEAEGFAVINIDTVDMRTMDDIIWSPGVPHTFPRPHKLAEKANDAGLTLRCDVDLLATAQPDATYIGITGTNGKSTTTALTGHVLKSVGKNVDVGGNLGVPALDLKPLGADGIYVLELSSYQVELTPNLSCATAALINIAPDHLDRHYGIAGYVTAKADLFSRQKASTTAIVGLDDEYSRNVFTALQDGLLFDGLDGVLKEAADLNGLAALPGQHNWQNTAACYAIARVHGISPEDITSAFTTFPGLPHRQEVVGTVTGVTFVNDSKATNATASEKALSCYSCIYWIAGGQAKEGGIAALAPLFGRIRHAFLIGEAADDFAETLQGAGVAVSHHKSLEDAVEQAGHLALRDGSSSATVLLSPACSSFDMFENFEQRGDAFKNIVHATWPETAASTPGLHA
jgi:UDP-N-acetylmuramoylalanine--D-glutamate ligase